jgi:hypothetical protein
MSLNHLVLLKNMDVSGYFELSTDSTFSKDLIKGKVDSIRTKIEQDFYSLKSRTIYYARPKLSFTMPGQAEKTFTGITMQFTTGAFGENLPEPKYDKINGLLRWQDFNPQVNPIPTKFGVTYIQWMSSDNLDKIYQTNSKPYLMVRPNIGLFFNLKNQFFPENRLHGDTPLNSPMVR